MGAKQNFVIAVAREAATFRKLLQSLEPLANELIGELRFLSIHNYGTGDIEDRALEGSALDSIPAIGCDEIASFYAEDMSAGVVSFAHEGAFDVMVMAVGKSVPVLDALPRIWERVGEYAIAVLAGEECEVEEAELVELLESGELPTHLDLCEAAVIKSPGHSSLGDAGETDVGWGARLLIAE